MAIAVLAAVVGRTVILASSRASFLPTHLSHTGFMGNCSAAKNLNGTSFHGDIKGQGNVDGPAACCNLCADNDKCTVWTFNTEIKTCYLRDASSLKKPFKNHVAVSGFTVPHPPIPAPAPQAPPGPPPPPLVPSPSPHPAPPPNPCTTCRGPVWDWEKFPAFFHSSDSAGTPGGGFTDIALDTIARFPMATIEKWQGSKLTPYIFDQDAWVVAAKQIKARSPNTTVVVWLDSFRIYTANKTLNPDLVGACTTGHFRPAQFLETHKEYLLKNSSGQPALESWSKCHIFDHTKEEARNFWRDMCLGMTASGVIDGCGADASWQTGVDQAKAWHLDPDTAQAWDAGHKAMMRMTTKALGDGVLLGKDPWEVGDYVNGALHEGCAASNETIITLRNLTSIAQAQGRRLVYQCHGKGELDEIAAFLTGVGEYQYYGFGGWQGTGNHGNFSGHWLPGVFDRRLGEPTAAAVYDGATSTWTRTFGSGTKVTFNAHTNKGTINWGS